MNSLSDKVREVRRRIALAADKAKRSADAITLVAVTKYVGAEKVAEAADAGIVHFGENRVQDATLKIQTSPKREERLVWHMIGRLQSNKASRAVEMFDRIDSVDSWDLASRLDRHAKALGKKLEVLVEVKFTQEAAKTGIAPGELLGFLEQWTDLEYLRLRGLMTMAPWTDNTEQIRSVFRHCRELFDTINARGAQRAPLDVLSMGMSGDFEIAIEEGATEIRVGQALFGPRDKPKAEE